MLSGLADVGSPPSSRTGRRSCCLEMSGGGLSVLVGSGCRISRCQRVGSLPATECNCFKRVSSSLFLHHLALAGTNSKSSGTLGFARQELQGLGFSKQSGLELLVTDVVFALSQKVASLC